MGIKIGKKFLLKTNRPRNIEKSLLKPSGHCMQHK